MQMASTMDSLYTRSLERRREMLSFCVLNEQSFTGKKPMGVHIRFVECPARTKQSQPGFCDYITRMVFSSRTTEQTVVEHVHNRNVYSISVDFSKADWTLNGVNYVEKPVFISLSKNCIISGTAISNMGLIDDLRVMVESVKFWEEEMEQELASVANDRPPTVEDMRAVVANDIPVWNMSAGTDIPEVFQGLVCVPETHELKVFSNNKTLELTKDDLPFFYVPGDSPHFHVPIVCAPRRIATFAINVVFKSMS